MLTTTLSSCCSVSYEISLKGGCNKYTHIIIIGLLFFLFLFMKNFSSPEKSNVPIHPSIHPPVRSMYERSIRYPLLSSAPAKWKKKGCCPRVPNRKTKQPQNQRKPPKTKASFIPVYCLSSPPRPSRPLSSTRRLLDESLETRGVGTEQLVDLLAVLEQHKRRHGADAELRRDLGDGIDVDLDEVHALERGVLRVPVGRGRCVRDSQGQLVGIRGGWDGGEDGTAVMVGRW